MIDKMNPLYFKGVRPIPVIPTVYTDALSYGEQLGIIGHKTDECVEKVNEVVDDNNTFKTELTTQQNTFETNITNQQSSFETAITNQQNTFETNITNQQNTYEQETTSGLNTWKTNTKAEFKEQIDDMNTEWDSFLEEYEQTYGVSQDLGESTINVVSQAGVTKEFNDRVLTYINITNFDVTGQYLRLSDGVATYDTNFDRTSLLPIPNKATKIVAYLYGIHTTIGSIVFYDEDSIFISAVDTTSNGNELLETTIPANARYVAFSKQNQQETQWAKIYIDITEQSVENNEALNDKVTSVDVITDFSFSGGYLLTSGIVNPNENFGTTEPIPIPPMAKELEFRLTNVKSIGANICFYDEERTLISYVSYGTPIGIAYGSVNIPQNAKLFRACVNLNYSGCYVKIVYDATSSIIHNNYLINSVSGTHINKPLNSFNNGNVVCIGDSIMVGYNPNAEIVDHPWINQFKDKANINNVSNFAQGGASFGTNSNSIISQLSGVNLQTRTHIFVAGGTNDYDKNIDSKVFIDSIDTLITYLNANKGANTNVIFITPINRVKQPTQDNKKPLEWYKDILTKKALEAGFSVIDGYDLGFPSVECDYMTNVMTDGLHPTQLGYNIYANSVASILL